jgi:hypothetical protein
MFRGVPVPGRFWPTCPTEQLISPQAELNKAQSQIADNAERIGNPPLLRSSLNEDFDWHALPGEEIVFMDVGTPGSIPQFMNVPELPAYVQQRVDRIEQSIREISGQHEVTSGAVPAGVTAASAINLLQEADDTRLGPDIADMEAALAGAGQRAVYLMARYFTDQRVVRVAGADGGWEFVAYRKGMLPDDQGIDVQAGSGLPQSKAAKQAAIQEVLNMLVQSGTKLSERDLRRVLQEYEVGGLEKFFSSIGEDERQIARENQRLASGIAGPDQRLRRRRPAHRGAQRVSQGRRLRRAPARTARRIVDAHCDAHLQRIATRAQTSRRRGHAARHPWPANGSGPPGAVPSVA